MPKSWPLRRLKASFNKKPGTAFDVGELEIGEASPVSVENESDDCPSGKLREEGETKLTQFESGRTLAERPPARHSSSAQFSRPTSSLVIRRERTSPAEVGSRQNLPVAISREAVWRQPETPLAGFPRFGHCATDLDTKGDRILVFGGESEGTTEDKEKLTFYVYTSG